MSSNHTPHFFNFRLDNGAFDGIYLYPGQAYWTFHVPVNEAVQAPVLQVRGLPPGEAEKVITPVTSDNEEFGPLDTVDFVLSDHEESDHQNRDQEVHSDESDNSAIDLPFLDENYSDQDSIQGTSHVEYLANSFASSTFNHSFAGSQHFDQVVNYLNLEIPLHGPFQPDRVYRLPGEDVVDSHTWQQTNQSPRRSFSSIDIRRLEGRFREIDGRQSNWTIFKNAISGAFRRPFRRE